MVCMILGLYTASNGLDISRKISWLIILFSSLFGILLGAGLIALTGGSTQEQINAGFALGFILSILTLFQGLIMRRHLKNSVRRDEIIKVLHLQLKERRNKNYFARIAEKILGLFV